MDLKDLRKRAQTDPEAAHVLADALLEAGDERGHLVRAQVEGKPLLPILDQHPNLRPPEGVLVEWRLDRWHRAATNDPTAFGSLEDHPDLVQKWFFGEESATLPVAAFNRLLVRDGEYVLVRPHATSTGVMQTLGALLDAATTMGTQAEMQWLQSTGPMVADRGWLLCRGAPIHILSIMAALAAVKLHQPIDLVDHWTVGQEYLNEFGESVEQPEYSGQRQEETERTGRGETLWPAGGRASLTIGPTSTDHGDLPHVVTFCHEQRGPIFGVLTLADPGPCDRVSLLADALPTGPDRRFVFGDREVTATGREFDELALRLRGVFDLVDDRPLPGLARWNTRLLRRFDLRAVPDDPTHPFWEAWNRLTKDERSLHTPGKVVATKLGPGRWVLHPEEGRLMAGHARGAVAALLRDAAKAGAQVTVSSLG